jgi:epoxyqueuosine reductase
MKLEDSLKKLAEELGTDFFGVANLSSAREYIYNFGGPAIAQFPRAVSIGISLLHPLSISFPIEKKRL